MLRTVDGVFGLVSDEKWDKMKQQLSELEEMVNQHPNMLSRKWIEQIRGFMNYIAQTYRYMIPYLNGLHMTLDGWRPGRDNEGWNRKSKVRDDVTSTSTDTTTLSDEDSTGLLESGVGR